MNLWFRLLALVLSARWRGPLAPPFGVTRVHLRVWPTDLDTSMHMNNGRYLTLMDLGRLDLILRSGLWRAVVRERWTPILGAATVRFRRELRLFQPFWIETRILCWTQAVLMIEQRVVARGRDGKKVLHAIALLRAGLYDRKAREHVTVDRILAAIGVQAVSPEPPPAVAALMASEAALRQAS